MNTHMPCLGINVRYVLCMPRQYAETSITCPCGVVLEIGINDNNDDGYATMMIIMMTMRLLLITKLFFGLASDW
jgi:hypothetical protein